jgi:hypothetical protein
MSGQALIPFDGSANDGGNIVASNPVTNVFTQFSMPVPNPPTIRLHTSWKGLPGCVCSRDRLPRY